LKIFLLKKKKILYCLNKVNTHLTCSLSWRNRLHVQKNFVQSLLIWHFMNYRWFYKIWYSTVCCLACYDQSSYVFASVIVSLWVRSSCQDGRGTRWLEISSSFAVWVISNFDVQIASNPGSKCERASIRPTCQSRSWAARHLFG
jgi:hypothetical protein